MQDHHKRRETEFNSAKEEGAPHHPPSAEANSRSSTSISRLHQALWVISGFATIFSVIKPRFCDLDPQELGPCVPTGWKMRHWLPWQLPFRGITPRCLKKTFLGCKMVRKKSFKKRGVKRIYNHKFANANALRKQRSGSLVEEACLRVSQAQGNVNSHISHFRSIGTRCLCLSLPKGSRKKIVE